MEERGFDGFTVNDLCVRADLNRGTFYNHYHDKEALLAALDENISSSGTRGIRAAALDVLADETAPNHALIEHPRCIVTPHTAYCTEEANDTLRRMTLKAQVDYLVRGIMPEHVVAA